jgi:hypothetical protein
LICTAPLAFEGRGLEDNDTVYFTDPLYALNLDQYT